MRGGDDTGEAPESRPTPSTGVGIPAGAAPRAEESNEDFLFHLFRGSELLQDDRAHEAKVELEQALRLQPHDTKGQDLLALVYFRLGQYPRAITIYEQLRHNNPKDTAILLNLALCYLKTGDAAAARHDLEQLLALNPAHARAWGYLGLACERLGDLEQAQRAFEKGGHGQMLKRIVERRASIPAAPAVRREESAAIPQPVDEAVAAPFEELDAGELSFTIAEPEKAEDDTPGPSWKSVPLGQREAEIAHRRETIKPETKDGPPPPPAPRTPLQPFGPTSDGRRPTLIAPAPPAPTAGEIERFFGPQSSKRPEDTLGPPSFRRPVVAVPPVRANQISASMRAGAQSMSPGERIETLPPQFEIPLTAPPPHVEALARDSIAPFPETGNVVIHASGLALVNTDPAASFAARLESLRVSSSGLGVETLERHSKGKPTGEAFGGVGSPIVRASGEGKLVLGPRPGRRILSFALADEVCFVREEALLGFDGRLAFENGRLTTAFGDATVIVQLRGTGAVLLEALGETLSFEVHHGRGLNVRREVLLAWFGRLVPRALAGVDAPGGQQGLVTFAGEGRVLVAAV